MKCADCGKKLNKKQEKAWKPSKYGLCEPDEDKFISEVERYTANGY